VSTLVRMLRWPSLLTAALVSAAILGCSAAVAPMFLTAAGSEIFTAHATRLQSAEALQMRDFNLMLEEFADYRDELIVENKPEGLTGPISTVWGEPIEIVSESGEENTVRAITRSEVFNNVVRLTRAAPEGVWLTDYNASELEVEAGDEITVSTLDAEVPLVVAGIYRDPLKDPVTDFWGPIREVVYPDAGEDTRPPAPMIMDQSTFFDLARAVGDDGGEYRWEFGLETTEMTLPEVEELAAGIAAFSAERSDDTTELGSSLLRANFISLVTGWVDLTSEAVASISGPVETIALGGTIVAFVIVAGTAFFTVTRRRIEFNLLHARGISPLRLGLRSVAEALLPLAIGAAAGWALAIFFVQTLGPPGLLDRSALADAAFEVAWRAAVAVVLYGISATLAVRLLAHEGFGRLQRAAHLPWEPVVLVLAGAAFYELNARGTASIEQADAVPTIDRLVILFPILFIAGAAGLIARGLRRVLPRLRTAGSNWRPSVYLASRRLGAAVRSAAALVTAAAIAVGMFFYAATLSTSVEATANQRALVQVGAETSASVSRPPREVQSDSFDSTPVTRLSGATITPGEQDVDILAIDPESFAGAAYWDGEFSDESLESLMDGLREGTAGGLAAIVAGDAPSAEVLSVSSYDIPVTVVGGAERFPGMVGGRPTIVVAARDLADQLEVAGGSLEGIAGRQLQVWSDGSQPALEAALEADDQPAFAFLTAAELRDTPSYLSLTWTFGLMKALGLLIGAVALLGTLLYLQTRQRERQVSYALSRRMGLRRSSHRTAVGIELTAMLAVAVTSGATLALIAATAMHDRIQLFTEGDAVPLLRIPVLLVAAGVVSLLAFAWGAAWFVQRAADRMDVAQVMRLAR
jgi:putative ABC transport system permease protein